MLCVDRLAARCKESLQLLREAFHSFEFDAQLLGFCLQVHAQLLGFRVKASIGVHAEHSHYVLLIDAYATFKLGLHLLGLAHGFECTPRVYSVGAAGMVGGGEHGGRG